MRLRELGITVGTIPTGPLNAITDVPGVRVGHATLVEGEGSLRVGRGPVRTGVTVLEPRLGPVRKEPVFAGAFTLNGNGDMTGIEWVREGGVLRTPIALTSTNSVGVVRDALVEAERRTRGDREVWWCLPVVGETYDGALNDINGFHIEPRHVHEALAAVRGGPVAEGCVGGGTGMVSYEFKGGIGTASRLLPEQSGGFTVAALVQANHGIRERLCIDGYPIGRHLPKSEISSPWDQLAEIRGVSAQPGAGSVVTVIATDAPLMPNQCARLAKRATNGVARGGGGSEDASGDIFLAFSTGNREIPRDEFLESAGIDFPLRSVTGEVLTELFIAAVEAVEEAIGNALVAATTTTGPDGIVAHCIDGDRLLEAMRRAGWPGPA